MHRRHRRHPLLGDDLPPFGMPVGSHAGVVVFEDGELTPCGPEDAGCYPHGGIDPLRAVWASWRMPTFRELARAEAAVEIDPAGPARGWWQATLDELDDRRLTLSAGRARSSLRR